MDLKYSLLFTTFSSIFVLMMLVNIIHGSCDDTKGLKWSIKPAGKYDGYIPFFIGEWWVIDCQLKNNSVKAKLLRRSFTNMDVLEEINEALCKEKSKNKFNITISASSDAGLYYCSACGKTKYVGGIWSRKGPAFARPLARKKPDAGILGFGDSAILECSVNGSYNDYDMVWYKIESSGRKKILRSKDVSKWGSKNDKLQRRVLKFQNLSKKDEGVYLCQISRFAVQYYASATIKLTLTDISPPKFVNFPDQQYKAVEGGNISFNYTVTGLPPQGITWYKIKNEKKERIIPNMESNSVSSITDKQFFVGGLTYEEYNNVTYFCNATNSFGSSFRNFSVLIEKKTVRTKDSKFGQVTVNSKPVTLICNGEWENITSGQRISVLGNKLTVEALSTLNVLVCTASIEQKEFEWAIIRTKEKSRNIKSKLSGDPPFDRNNEAEMQAKVWRFLAIFMGCLLLLLLFLIALLGKKGEKAQIKKIEVVKTRV